MAGKDEFLDDLMPETPEIEREIEAPVDEPDAGGDTAGEDDAAAAASLGPDGEQPDPNETAEEKEVREQQAREKKTGKFKSGKEKVVVPKAAAPAAPPQQQPQTVPLAVLLQERNTTKAELAALRAELEKLRNPPKVEAPPTIPDYATDPKGYVDGKTAELLAKQDALDKQTAERTQNATQAAQQSAQRTEDVAFARRLEQAEASFIAQTPDYYEALAHVREIRAGQLRTLAPGITDQEIVDQIGREEFQLARNLHAQQRNPIATVYELAKQFGYQPKAAAPAEKLPPVPGGPRVLPPDQRLGSGGGKDADDDDVNPSGGEEYQDPFDSAFNEMFKKKRA